MENFTKILSLIILCLFVSFLITEYQERPTDTETYYNIASSTPTYGSSLTNFLLKATGFLKYNQFIFLWVLFFHLAILSIFVVGFGRLDLAFLSSIAAGFMILSFAFGQMLCLIFFILTIILFQRKSIWWIAFIVPILLSHRLGFIFILILFIAIGLAKIFKNRDFSLFFGTCMFSLMGVSIGFSAAIYVFDKAYYDVFTHCLVVIPLSFLFFSKNRSIFWKSLIVLLASGAVLLPFIFPIEITSTSSYIGWRAFGMFDLIILIALAETKTRMDEFLFGFLLLAMGIKTVLGVV